MKDKEYCFDFGVTNQLKIISNKYFYLNNFLLNLIGNPTEVNIGIDNQNKAMLIKPVDKRLGFVKFYKINRNKIYSNTAVKQVLNITNKKSFDVVFDKELGGLLVELGD